LVCLRYRPPDLPDDEVDELNRRLLARVNAGGKVHLTHTKLGGRYAIRMVVGQRMTELHHVAQGWELLKEAAAARIPV
jgi:aromatic-L-amino-acid/L-tryptophan decarboxylase